MTQADCTIPEARVPRDTTPRSENLATRLFYLRKALGANPCETLQRYLRRSTAGRLRAFSIADLIDPVSERPNTLRIYRAGGGFIDVYWEETETLNEQPLSPCGKEAPPCTNQAHITNPLLTIVRLVRKQAGSPCPPDLYRYTVSVEGHFVGRDCFMITLSFAHCDKGMHMLNIRYDGDTCRDLVHEFS